MQHLTLLHTIYWRDGAYTQETITTRQGDLDLPLYRVEPDGATLTVLATTVHGETEQRRVALDDADPTPPYLSIENARMVESLLRDGWQLDEQHVESWGDAERFHITAYQFSRA